MVDAIISDPAVAIASDGGRSHPCEAGTRVRVLARYVRDEKALTLSNAIRTLSLMPVRNASTLS